MQVLDLSGAGTPETVRAVGGVHDGTFRQHRQAVLTEPRQQPRNSVTSTRVLPPVTDVAPDATLVAVIESQPLYRDALERAISADDGLSVVVSAASVQEFQARVRARPDVLIVDMQPRASAGIERVRRLVEQGFSVLVLSTSSEGPDVVDTIAAGARGYLLKDATAVEILAAVGAVATGRSYVSPTLAGLLLQGRRPPVPKDPDLSERERGVLELVARGCTDHVIATELNIGVSTVRSHLDRIRDKTGHRRRADLTRFAIEHAILGS